LWEERDFLLQELTKVWEEEEGHFLAQTPRKVRDVEEEGHFLAQTLLKGSEEE
jgi:hypothetical protein